MASQIIATAPQLGAESTARRKLALESVCEIEKLADAVKRLAADHEDEAVFSGIMSRIELLSSIVFHAVRLDGTDGSGWGDRDDIKKLQRVFDGRMA